jgi:hypothetical protein
MISAPENPSVILPKKLKSTSGATGLFLKLALKIPTQDFRSGKGIYIS